MVGDEKGEMGRVVIGREGTEMEMKGKGGLGRVVILSMSVL